MSFHDQTAANYSESLEAYNPGPEYAERAQRIVEAATACIQSWDSIAFKDMDLGIMRKGSVALLEAIRDLEDRVTAHEHRQEAQA